MRGGAERSAQPGRHLVAVWWWWGGCEGERGCSAALHVSGLCLPSLQADVQHQDVRPHGWRRCHRLGAGGPGQYPGGLGLSVRKRGGGGRPSASEPGKRSWRWCLRSRRCALHTRGVQAARFYASHCPLWSPQGFRGETVPKLWKAIRCAGRAGLGQCSRYSCWLFSFELGIFAFCCTGLHQEALAGALVCVRGSAYSGVVTAR